MPHKWELQIQRQNQETAQLWVARKRKEKEFNNFHLHEKLFVLALLDDVVQFRRRCGLRQVFHVGKPIVRFLSLASCHSPVNWYGAKRVLFLFVQFYKWNGIDCDWVWKPRATRLFNLLFTLHLQWQRIGACDTSNNIFRLSGSFEKVPCAHILHDKNDNWSIKLHLTEPALMVIAWTGWLVLPCALHTYIIRWQLTADRLFSSIGEISNPTASTKVQQEGLFALKFRDQLLFIAPLICYFQFASLNFLFRVHVTRRSRYACESMWHSKRPKTKIMSLGTNRLSIKVTLTLWIVNSCSAFASYILIVE